METTVHVPSGRASSRWSAILVGAVAAQGLLVTVARAETSGFAQANAAPYAAQYLTLGASAASAFTASSGSALDQMTRLQTGSQDAPAPPLLASLSFTTRSRLTPARLFSPEPAARRRPAAAASSGAPDVFGSTALAVSGSALDGRWRKVAHARTPGSRRWRQVVAATAALPKGQQLAHVNAWVNQAIRFEDDIDVYGARDYWASARESLTRRRGDCEDYAIAKMQLLEAAGAPRGSLYLIVARDLVRRVDHAVLAVRVDGEFWILDNSTDAVLAARDIVDYRPVVTYSAEKAWIHGYERAPSVMLASTEGLSPAGLGGRP